MNDIQRREIDVWMQKLDRSVSKYEASWGVMNLERYCNPDTAEKINRQREKLYDAIQEGDVYNVGELVKGFIRGYELMEKEAVQNGHSRISPDFWEVRLEDGFCLRVARSSDEAAMVTQKGVYVYSLKEVARILRSDYTLINELKKTFPEAKLTEIEDARKPFDWKEGDDLPF